MIQCKCSVCRIYRLHIDKLLEHWLSSFSTNNNEENTKQNSQYSILTSIACDWSKVLKPVPQCYQKTYTLKQSVVHCHVKQGTSREIL